MMARVLGSQSSENDLLQSTMQYKAINKPWMEQSGLKFGW